MNDWATRRKNLYLFFIVIFLSSISFFIFWKFWYSPPNCFDGLKNGSEEGVDCGGGCSLLCSASVIGPVIRWDPRLFEIEEGIWNMLIYVENQNPNATASYMPYTLTIYDDLGNVLVKKEGATILPKNKISAVFEGGIRIANSQRPSRASFEIGENITWSNDTEIKYEIDVRHTSLLNQEDSPKIEAVVKNKGIKSVKNIELVAAIFDRQDNAISASRTFVQELKKNTETKIFFTWPRAFDLGSKICEKDSDVMLAIDRSGSMSSISVSPPEPLTKAKEAAKSFVQSLGTLDKIGVVSFANEVKNPIDISLTSDFQSVLSLLDSISIDKNGTQYTNIYDALRASREEISKSKNSGSLSEGVIILLTDGIANKPKNPTGKSEADDISYAENLAIKESEKIKNDGISIYTVGLGQNIKTSFLENVASRKENYFFAPNAEDLKKIYKDISSEICKEVPARIDITYKVFGDSI